MKIVIVAIDRLFEVRVIYDRGLTTRTFTYTGLQQARKAAVAWSSAYGDCPIIDQTGGKTP
jgi:hypothetical protein